MASSALTHPVTKDEEYENWAELPYELTSSILSRLCAVDILESAQIVCKSWRYVCKDPRMWRTIDMRRLGHLEYDMKYVTLCRHAVDRSQGGLVEIDIWYIGTDSLLNYIADRSSNLRSLRLGLCDLFTNEGLTEVLVKLPLLEELEVSCCPLSGESLKVVGQSCPNLKTLMLNRRRFRRPMYVINTDALAIAETMPGLSFLQLFGNLLSDTGLKAILDNCPDLEYLDLRLCLNVNFAGDLEKLCSEKIKVLRRPDDSTHDSPYEVFYYDTDPSEDNYYYEGYSSEDDYREDYYPEDCYPEDNYFPVSRDDPDYDLYDIDIFGFASVRW